MFSFKSIMFQSLTHHDSALVEPLISHSSRSQHTHRASVDVFVSSLIESLSQMPASKILIINRRTVGWCKCIDTMQEISRQEIENHEQSAPFIKFFRPKKNPCYVNFVCQTQIHWEINAVWVSRPSRSITLPDSRSWRGTLDRTKEPSDAHAPAILHLSNVAKRVSRA